MDGDEGGGNLSTQDDFSDPCFFAEPVYVKERFWMVAIFGTIISIINILENSFLCFMLFKKKSHRSSHLLYLALLAFFDVWMAVAYIPLMSLNLFVDYYQSVVLLRAWFMYMLPMITVSHIAMTASSFLMVVASLERYCITVHPTKTRWLQKNRMTIAGISILLGVACKFSQLFEMEINYQPECYGTMKEYQLSLSPLAQNPIYNYWRALFRTIITILIPFFILVYINIRIVYDLNKKEFKFLHSTKLSDAKRKVLSLSLSLSFSLSLSLSLCFSILLSFHFSFEKFSQFQKAVRNATKTMVFVVCTYLLSNILNVVIILWEYIDYDTITNKFLTFYMFAVDVVSLSTIFAGALRLPIYVTCQANLRREFSAQFKKLLSITAYKGYASSPSKSNTTSVDRRTPEEDDGDVIDEPPSSSLPQYPMLLSLGTVLLVERDNNNASSTTCKVIRGDMKTSSPSSSSSSELTCQKLPNI